jgi:phytoene dehydrogenase-like protein
MKYDVIIIGSGLGGLVCGAGLSQTGKRVLVLERQLQPGGCLQSFRRQGLSFDTGLHYVGGLTPGHRIYEAFSYLGLMDLPWQRMDDSGFDRITIGDTTYPLASGYDNFVDTLAQYFPKERENLCKYVEML